MGTRALDLGLLALLAPFFRYLLGAQLVDSGGSILAIGRSFNASGQMSAGPRRVAVRAGHDHAHPGCDGVSPVAWPFCHPRVCPSVVADPATVRAAWELVG